MKTFLRPIFHLCVYCLVCIQANSQDLILANDKPYRTEEVQFVNPADSAVLSGTLTYPIDYEKMPKDSVRVVLMVTGSGLQNRDEEIFGHKPFQVIADYFARHGIASLRYDDRGYGRSTGDVSKATTFTFMQDAQCGINFLNSLQKFGDVGVLGHSEGGTIALMAGMNESDFIIALAATTVRGDKLLVEQNRKILKLNGVSDKLTVDYCKVLEEVFCWKIEKHPIEHPQQVLAGLIKQVEAELPVEYQQNLLQVLVLQDYWTNAFLAFDPEADIAQTCLTRPVMALYGEKDVQVPSGMNMEVLKRHASNKTFTKEYPELNHLFQHSLTGNVTEYAQIKETISEEVLRDMVQWIKGLPYQSEMVFVDGIPTPEFPGGTEALVNFMKENLSYPKELLPDDYIEGRVFVRFIVDEQGKVLFPTIFRGLHPLLDAEALRVVSLMPTWIPARDVIHKEPIKQLFTLPVAFKAQRE